MKCASLVYVECATLAQHFNGSRTKYIPCVVCKSTVLPRVFFRGWVGSPWCHEWNCSDHVGRKVSSMVLTPVSVAFVLLLVFRDAILSCDLSWLNHHELAEVIGNIKSSRAWYRDWSMLIPHALARFSIMETCESPPTCEFTRAHNAQSESEHRWRFTATLE